MRILLLGFSQKETNYEIKSLLKELKGRGHVVHYVFWSGLVFSFSKKDGVVIKKVRDGRDLKYYDYIIPRSPVATGGPSQKKSQRLYLSHLYRHYLLIVDYINKYYKHILNEKTAKRMLFYDKLFQHYLLAKHGLPVISSLLYTGRQLPDSVYSRFKTPYILKSIEGSRGRQVFLVDDKKEIGPRIKEFGRGKLLVQRYLPSKQDYRIIVIGNRVVGSMKRVAAEGEFRANVSLGGTVESVKVSKELRQLALRAAKVFNAEFAGVDVMKYKGRYYLLEVNIFPMFAGFEEATGINVAKELVQYIEKRYLWSIDTSMDKKERLEMLDKLYKIEKDKKGEPPLLKTKLREELKKRELIVIKKEGKPIAFLLHYRKGKTRRITHLVVAPKYLGQRLGRRMLQALVHIAKNEGDKRIRAVVPISNKKRQQSFKKAGFKKRGTLRDHYADGRDGYAFEYNVAAKKRVKGTGLTKTKEK